MCKICPEAKKQMLFIKEAMGRLAAEIAGHESDVSLSPEARDRIKLALSRK